MKERFTAKCEWGKHEWDTTDRCIYCDVKALRCRYGHDHTDEWMLSREIDAGIERLDFSWADSK